MWSAQILRYLDETKSWIKNHTCKNCNFEINLYGFSLIACFFYGDVVEWCVFRIIISNSNRLPQPNHHLPHSITRPPQPETRLPLPETRYPKSFLISCNFNNASIGVKVLMSILLILSFNC
jgi:hypothetical protein